MVNSLYWLFGLIFASFDLSSNTHMISRYKIQAGKNEPLDRGRLRQTCKVVLFNQVCVSGPVMAVLYPCFRWRGNSTTLPLPSFERFLFEMVCFILVEEVLFYYSHRLLHTKWFYGRFHKIHHQWNAPIAVSALYCHPVEHVFSNLLPLMVGPFIMGSHLAVMWVWFSMAVLNTLHVHSGYHLPFLPSPESHDFHHLRFNENFGVLGLMDYLHGTDIEFRASTQYLEHRTYFSFDEYPDKHQNGEIKMVIKEKKKPSPQLKSNDEAKGNKTKQN
jgi:methylsterol monooxygenase